tara:strand:- start:6 stop:761 length:756 start_codon:yes stop_codon:yes gene_type:complete
MFAEETLGGVPADDMWAFLNDDGAGNVTAYSSLAEAPPPLATNFQALPTLGTYGATPGGVNNGGGGVNNGGGGVANTVPPKTITERPRFDIICPKKGCNITNDTLDKLSGTGQSRRGYYCSPARGGCGERWSQRIYKDDEVSHLPNLGSHNPHIKKSKKLSPRERKMKMQQMLHALEDEVCTVVGQTVPASDYSDMQCAGDGCKRSFSGTNPRLEATQCSECQRWFCKIDCSDAYSFGLQWMCNGCVAGLA